TAAGIPTWSPTVVLICRSTAYVWQSGRDAQFSADCGQIMGVTSQQVSASRMQAAKNDGNILSSARISTLSCDDNSSLASQCMTFQSRIDSYTSELNRLEAMNHAIRKEYHKRQQEQHRDRLIDSASPEPRIVTVREEKHQMVLKKLRKRRRRLIRGLAVVKEEMKKLKTEIESVSQEVNVGDS
ncbi:hypothetical protein KCU64_g20431, partial [Aureobasidium melanogenum]